MADNAVVYYSRTGTSRSVAEHIGTTLGWPIYEVIDLKIRTGLLGDMQCMFDALFGLTPLVRYDGPPFYELGHALIIAPVWVGSMATPMLHTLRQQSPFFGTLSVICVMTGKSGARALSNAAQAAGRRHADHTLVLRQANVLSGQAIKTMDEFSVKLADLSPSSEWLSLSNA